MHPDRIGPYLIEKRIGAGGMGNVYLGKHETTGEVAAIKELPASLAREEGFVHRFNREIEAMGKLNNPHIVKFFNSGSDNDSYYYSMEYVDGETLTSKLRRERRIPWVEAIQIAIEICGGLKHAHDVGVVHRDLKPSNLLIAKDGTVKIADFGVAQVFAADRLTSTGGVIGTAEFMSPEQVVGTRVDKRSDLYSLGAVLYTMLVGQPPFLGPTASDIMQKQRFGRFDPPRKFVPEVPSWLDEIVCQLLEKDPEKRPPDAFVTAKRLKEVLKKVDLRDTGPEGSPSDVTRVEDDGSGKKIGATFVRDLIRFDATDRAPTTVLGRAMDNTWVLITLLILVLCGAGWLYFRPGGNSIAFDEESTDMTEAERIVQLARWRSKGGDAHSALAQLEALEAVIQGDSQNHDTMRAINRMRTAIHNQLKSANQIGFVTSALERADKLADQDRAKARKIYQGLITLYGNDPGVESLVRTAREKLKALGDAPETPSN